MLHLNNTWSILQAKVNLFNIKKLRKAHYWVELPERIGREWIRRENGKYVGSVTEDEEGRAVVDYTTLLPSSPSPSPSLFPLEMAPVQEASEEVMVAAIRG